jgi:hypothetical protein
MLPPPDDRTPLSNVTLGVRFIIEGGAQEHVMISLWRLAYTIVLPAMVLFGSFFITLWLTAPESTISTDNRSDAERLAAFPVSNDSDLATAARNAELRLSRNLDGNVDALSRTSQSDVMAAGWFADHEGDATPLEVLVFVGGPLVARTQTKGERPDVTQARHLGFGAEKNVSFSVTFNCRAGDQPVIAGTGRSHQYFRLQSGRCP